MPDISKSKPEASPAPKVITTGNVLLLCAALAVFTALLIWFFLGTVRVSFTYNGALTVRDDAVTIHEPDDAVVTDIPVILNQYVHKGDVLLRIYPDTAGEAATLDQMQSEAKDVLSPVSGFVTEICVGQWERVDLSTTLLRVLPAKSRAVDCAVAYVSVDDIDVINVGTEVKVWLEGSGDVSRRTLRGQVIRMTDLPVSEDRMLEALGSGNIVRYFYEGTTQQYEVLIELDKEDRTHNADGGRIRRSSLVCNETCRITFFSEETHPYQIVFES